MGDPASGLAAAYALSGCPARAADIGPALRQRWSVEVDARVRAGLVMAVAALDPRTDLVNEALGTGQPPAVRAAAVLAIVQSGRRWPGKRAVAAVREAWRHGDPFVDPEDAEKAWRPKAFYAGALEYLLELLNPADRRPIVAALLDSPDPQVRARAAMQASSAMGEYRSVRRPLADVLVRSLTDAQPLVRLAAADAIRRAGPAAAHAADALAAMVDGHDDEAAGQALAALVELGDPRAARHLPARIRAGTAADDVGAALVAAGTEVDAELLDAVRGRMREMATGTPDGRQIDVIRSTPGRSHYVDSERTTLLMLLQSWGPAAAPATGELAALLPAVPTAERVADVLAAIGPDAAPALPALRAHTETIRGEHMRNAELVAVTRACWRIDGDPEPAIDEAWQHITGEGAGLRAADLLAEIGDPARRLLPAIRRALPGWLENSEWYQDERLAVAKMIWQWTGDVGPALSMAKVFLGINLGGIVAYGQFEAAILAVELGDATAAAALTSIASADNGSYEQRVRACRTLWRITGDAGPALPALLDAMTTADYPPTKDSWTGLLGFLAELGPAASRCGRHWNGWPNGTKAWPPPPPPPRRVRAWWTSRSARRSGCLRDRRAQRDGVIKLSRASAGAVRNPRVVASARYRRCAVPRSR